MNDGYFRRVRYMDDLLAEHPRIFLDLEKSPKKTKLESYDNQKIVVTCSRNRIVRLAIMAIILLLCHRVYCESVWQVRAKFFKFPRVRAYVDMHGSVPEEEFLYGRYEAAQKYGDLEELTVKNAKYIICVTAAMEEHLRKKYGDQLQAKTFVLPIVDDNILSETKVQKKSHKKPVVVYAGGIFAWQNIEMMQQAIQQQLELAEYFVYTPTPDKFWETWGKAPRGKVSVKAVTPDYLREKGYPQADYGFVLRDDIVVNNVACPTKISEYLRYGIIPIMHTDRVGDFVKLGMQYVKLADFCAGKLPSEKQRQKMIAANYACLEKYAKVCRTGAKEFKEVMNHA